MINEENTSNILYSINDANGFELSLEEAEFNTLIMGDSNSGKTQSIILPMAIQLLNNCIPGLIIDIKSEIGPYIRHYFRKKELLPYMYCVGDNSDLQINIFENFTPDDYRKILLTLIHSKLKNSEPEYQWVLQGLDDLISIAKIDTQISSVSSSNIYHSHRGLKRLLLYINNRSFFAELYKKYQSIGFYNSHKDVINDQIKALEADDNSLWYYQHKGEACEKILPWRINYMKNLLEELIEKIPDSLMEGSMSIEDVILTRKRSLVFQGDKSQYNDNLLIAKIVLFAYEKEIYEKKIIVARKEKVDSLQTTFLIADNFDEYDSFDKTNTALSNDQFTANSTNSKQINIYACRSVSSLNKSNGPNSDTNDFFQSCKNIICLKTSDKPTYDYIDFLSDSTKVSCLHPSATPHQAFLRTNKMHGFYSLNEESLPEPSRCFFSDEVNLYPRPLNVEELIQLRHTE